MNTFRCRYCKRQVTVHPINDTLPRDRCPVGSTGRTGFHLWKRVR
jgi:hypothetical protein